MPYIIALFGIVIGAWFWIQRARMAAEATQDLAGVAQDVMAAARRFGFRRKHDQHPVESLDDPDVAIAAAGVAFLELGGHPRDQHPVESLDDPDVAIAAAGVAFLELGGLPSSQQHDRLIVSLQSHLGQSQDKAEEAAILGRWLVGESGGALPGFDRLTRRLFKLKGAQGFQPLMSVLKDVASASREGTLSTRQREALEEVARLFRIS